MLVRIDRSRRAAMRCGSLGWLLLGVASLGLVPLVLLVSLAGCDAQPPGATSAPAYDPVPPPQRSPTYSFADGLPERYPDAVGFMRHFLETCLAGDYAQYRQLVSRARDPESRDRFMKVLYALKSLRVDAIEEISIGDIAPPVFLVRVHTEFHTGDQVALRRRQQDVSILVFREQDEWRMLPAPASLQPRAPESQPSSDEAAEVLPEFPWEDGADY